MTTIVRATARHLLPLADLMTRSPLLRRYGVTARSANRSLTEGLRGRDLLLVALDGDAAVGLAWVITTRALDRSAYLRLLLVAEGAQSRGIGAALLSRAEREAKAERCRHFVLLVTRSNRRARAFYASHGYTHVGDLPNFVRRGIAESLYLKSWRA